MNVDMSSNMRCVSSCEARNSATGWSLPVKGRRSGCQCGLGRQRTSNTKSASLGTPCLKPKDSIYNGNVILVQGSINLKASKVIVYNFQSDDAHIVATGNQVSFSQKQDNSADLIKGRANKVEYGINSARLELTGKGSLVKGKNTFRNDKIIYDREKAIVKAGTSAKGKERVKITIGGKK